MFCSVSEKGTHFPQYIQWRCPPMARPHQQNKISKCIQYVFKTSKGRGFLTGLCRHNFNHATTLQWSLIHSKLRCNYKQVFKKWQNKAAKLNKKWEDLVVHPLCSWDRQPGFEAWLYASCLSNLWQTWLLGLSLPICKMGVIIIVTYLVGMWWGVNGMF